MHGYSEEDWIKYIERRLEDKEKSRFDLHLAECVECRDFHERMLRTETVLQEMGLKIRKSVSVSSEQINLGLANVLARILDSEAKQQNLGQDAIKIRLEQLEDILAVMCGSWTAVNALRVAAEETIANTPANLSQETWTPFLKRLKAIASVFCGDEGAKFVWEYGQL